MELITAIALLCQVSIAGAGESGIQGHEFRQTQKQQLECQQRYLHCVKTKSTDKATALEQCVMEKK